MKEDEAKSVEFFAQTQITVNHKSRATETTIIENICDDHYSDYKHVL